MIPKECKRLIEVDFPIAEVSKQAAREKSIRHGHPSTLHLWWARRPLASSRAVLMGLLLPDPGDENCPEEFKNKARELLPNIVGAVGKTDEELRAKLLKFIADFSNWDNSTSPLHLEVARGLVKAAHGAEPPLVVDPFSGGGTIPLEALRLGCDAFASDLNPVACMINRLMLQDIPRIGHSFGADVREAGAAMESQSESGMNEFYPVDEKGRKPLAYIWARTIQCESPNCGTEFPLVRSFWLSKSALRKTAIRYRLVSKVGRNKSLSFEIFHPDSDSDVPPPTVSLANATCPSCGTVLRAKRVRAQLSKQSGGGRAIFDQKGNRIGGAIILAVVVKSDDHDVREYRLAEPIDYEGVFRAQSLLPRIPRELIPDENLPRPRGPEENTGVYYNFIPAILYGIKDWSGLFSERQLIAVAELVGRVRHMSDASPRESAVKRAIGIAISRALPQWCTLSWWQSEGEFVVSAFGRQALPMVWDFVEANPWSGTSGGLHGSVDWVARVLEEGAILPNPGEVYLADASDLPLADRSSAVWFTDPPYYDAVPYSYLSNFFLVWMKRMFNNDDWLSDPFDKINRLAPTEREIIEDLDLLRGIPKDRAKQLGFKVKDKAYFEERMAEAFSQSRRILLDDGIGCVVFAHKTTEGWEALLNGLVKGGWILTGSWPITTERSARPRARNSAALSASVHLVCRPRLSKSATGDWPKVYGEMKEKVANWMERLASEGVHGADLVFACIGPALEVYSRYEKVVDANDREIPLGGNPLATEPYERGYLAYIWEVVGRTALEQVLGTAEAKARNGAAGVLEEDSRLTALFLWTLMSSASETGNGENAKEEEVDEEAEDEDEEPKPGKKKAGYALVFDVVRRFAQPLGIDLDKWKGRIIDIEKGSVRLIPLKERARQLFGEDSFSKIAAKMEKAESNKIQTVLFPDEESPEIITPKRTARARKSGPTQEQEPREATTLDRVHAAMLLQASGQAGALKALIKSEQDRGSDFVRLANALSALYPRKSEDKRLLDAMLLTIPKR